MEQILRFLVEHCSFLLAPDRYRFADSRASASFGGDAYLMLSGERLDVRFVRDRGQLFLDVRGTGDATEWFSIDLIRRLVTRDRPESAVLDEACARFLRDDLDDIEDRFADTGRRADTLVALAAMRRERSKETFGG